MSNLHGSCFIFSSVLYFDDIGNCFDSRVLLPQRAMSYSLPKQ